MKKVPPPNFLRDGTYLLLCSPEGIRTLVADLRSQSPGPLDDGAPVFSIPHDLAVIGTVFNSRWPFGLWNSLLINGELSILYLLSCTALGYQDSNLDLLNQNQQGCQLPHTPRQFLRTHVRGESLPDQQGCFCHSP
jgi:hypothetical protein